jgi:hypothetical protein
MNKRNIPEYRSWSSMRSRCYNVNNCKYYTYGDRGIIVCERWKDSFENFYADMGPKPEPKRKYSLHRINNDDNYYKENCKWATPQEQADCKTTTTYVIINNEKKNLKQWCKFYKINYRTVLFRIREMNMTSEEAITTKLKKPFRRMYTIDGETKNIKDWSRHYKIPYQRLLYRLKQHGNIKKAIIDPVIKRNIKSKEDRLIEYNGKKQILSKWAKEYNINPISLYYRLSHGWSIGDALNTPIRSCK